MTAMQLPQFRWLFAGNIAFFFVVQGQMVTRTFLAWELTHKESTLALISMMVAVPMLLTSVISGAITDRYDHRKLIIGGQLVLLFNEVFVLVMLWLGKLALWHLLGVAFVAGCTFPFIMTARMVITFDIVGANHFGNAMALSNGVINLSRVAGPAVIGIVLDVFDARAAYLLGVVLFVLALLCMLPIHPNKPVKSVDKPLLGDVAEGFRYVLDHRAILICIGFGLLPMVLAMPVQSLFVVFSDEVWQVGERGFGTMVAASGVGGVIGSMWVAGRGDRPNRLKVMVVSVLLFCLMLMLFSLSPVFWFALLALVLANIFVSASQTIGNTITLLLADANMKGRVSGLMGMSFGLTPLGVIPLAFAAEKFGVAIAVTGACVVLMALVTGFYYASATLRNMDRHVLHHLDKGRSELE
jgi:MFS family permease